MQPVQELLHRIRWDDEYGHADFEIGYYDRIEDRVVRIPFAALRFPEESRRVFELIDPGGEVRRVPFHRVREIYRDEQLIWRRRG